MKKILLIFFSLLSISYAQDVDHSIFTELMKEYNFKGNLNYKGLSEDNRLDIYLKILSETNPGNLGSDESKISFWINVYNAFTIKAIVDNYPVESINDLHSGGKIISYIFSTTVWDDEFIIINGKEYSLNDIEHSILRKKYKESRIHFAIVCASISCPSLRNEAFTKDKLESQLKEQATRFFNDETRNKIDIKNKTAYLSKILDWFEEDFGESDEEILLYVSKYLDTTISIDIRDNLDEWSIEYLDYDWGLNEHKIN